jgi:hypothetical protein
MALGALARSGFLALTIAYSCVLVAYLTNCPLSRLAAQCAQAGEKWLSPSLAEGLLRGRFAQVIYFPTKFRAAAWTDLFEH